MSPLRADFIELTDEASRRQNSNSTPSLIRRDGATGKVLWDALCPSRRFTRKEDPAQWLPRTADEAKQHRILEPAVDLNGDGTRDILWFVHQTPAVVAPRAGMARCSGVTCPRPLVAGKSASATSPASRALRR